MRTNWSRRTAILGLLIAIFSDLRRRAWWLGRKSAFGVVPHPMALAAPRPAEQRCRIDGVAWHWRPVVARALPVQATAMVPRADGTQVPMIVVDVTDRPELADMPRVLAAEMDVDSEAVVGANWLAEPALGQAVLVVTFVEPVTCTWAVGFDLPRCLSLLEQVIDGHELYVAWHSTPEDGAPERSAGDLEAIPSQGLLLRVGRLDHLRAILDGWAAEHERR